jgi:hypothetical protein
LSTIDAVSSAKKEMMNKADPVSIVQNAEITERFPKPHAFSARITVFPLTNTCDYDKINITISMRKCIPYIREKGGIPDAE